MAAAAPKVWNRWQTRNRHRDSLNRDSTYEVVPAQPPPRPWSGSSFGSTNYIGGVSRRNSHLNIVPEERASEYEVEDEDIEWLLHEQGLYTGERENNLIR